ncbi:MAG: response regulator transcription factor [Pseudomonadota bacterium]
MENADQKRILVIEDEEHIAEGIKLNLGMQGYDVMTASDGLDGIDRWQSWKPDLIVLDIMLPVVDGLSVLKSIRKEDAMLPVLILSAKSSAQDKVRGLQAGVDDYLAKPFDLDEFLLRVQRLLARQSWYREKNGPGAAHGTAVMDGEYRFGDNRVDFSTGKAVCEAGTIVLTEQEIKLFKAFVANRGKPVSRQKLLEAGWGYSSDTTTRTVDNFMVRFRKYFEKNPKHPRYFQSRRSVGYLFDH